MQLWKHLKYGIQLGSIFFLRDQVFWIKETKTLIALHIDACVILYFPIITVKLSQKCLSDYKLEVSWPETRKHRIKGCQIPTTAKYDRLWFSRRFFWFADRQQPFLQWTCFIQPVYCYKRKSSFHIPLAFRWVKFAAVKFCIFIESCLCRTYSDDPRSDSNTTDTCPHLF